MTHPTSEMMILLSFLVLCVANNLVSTSEVNAPAPRSTNLTAVPTNLTADKLPLEKNQTLQGRQGSVLSTSLNIQSPYNNTVKKMIPPEYRGPQIPGDRRDNFGDNRDPFRNQPYPGDRRDPFRDNRDPFRNQPYPGDRRDPFRDNRDPFRNQPQFPGDRRDPFRDNRDPFRNQPHPGDRRDPFRDNRDPFRNQPQFPGDRRDPFRDNRDPFRNQPHPGDRRDPFRDNRDPFRNQPQFPGDRRDPFRDNRDPFRNQPHPGDRREPFRDNRDPFRNHPQFPGDRREPFRDNRDPFRNQPRNQPRDNRNFRVPRENLVPSRLYPQLPGYVYHHGINLAPLKVNRRPIRFDSMYGFQVAGKNNDGGLYGLPIQLGIQGSVLSVDQNPTDQASGNQPEGFLNGSGGFEIPAEAIS